jgi:hypothetical protein
MAKEYPQVQRAILLGDSEELSRLGRIGGWKSGQARRIKRAKRLVAEREEKETLKMLRETHFQVGVREKLAQGNEDWCPPH